MICRCLRHSCAALAGLACAWWVWSAPLAEFRAEAGYGGPGSSKGERDDGWLSRVLEMTTRKTRVIGSESYRLRDNGPASGPSLVRPGYALSRTGWSGRLSTPCGITKRPRSVHKQPRHRWQVDCNPIREPSLQGYAQLTRELLESCFNFFRPHDF